jgi:probable HAF family extracellular repeat protein
MKRNHSRINPLFALMLILGLSMAHPAAAQKYTITDLDTLGGPQTFAYDVNEQGQVVGTSQISGSGGQFDLPTHAFIWSDGKIADLGTLGGQRSYAYSINQLGLVVGYSYTSDNSNGGAFLWSEGMLMQNLGTLPNGGVSMAYGINKAGQITGFSTLGSGNHAFLLTNGEMSDLGTLGGSYSYGMGINDSGQVVGYSENTNNEAHAFLWENDNMKDLGTLGGPDSYANRINNTGQVVGQSLTAGGESHAFFLGKNGMVDLGTLGGYESEALGINDLGQVAGSSTTIINESVRSHAFIWQDGQDMQDLNNLIPADSGWELVAASGINKRGQIVGWGYINAVEVERAFLLTPVEEPQVLGVKINIKPWSRSKRINPWDKWELVPVAILSSPDFDASRTVDRRSLTFGRTGDEDSLAFCHRWSLDTNRDRLKDLICYFHVGPMGFHCGDKEGVLRGKTVDGKEFEGTDEVQIDPCHDGCRDHHEH